MTGVTINVFDPTSLQPLIQLLGEIYISQLGIQIALKTPRDMCDTSPISRLGLLEYLIIKFPGTLIP